MDRDADVLILGAGVVGLACAHYLLAEGRSVRVLDQGRVGGGASHGNCGTLTPSHAPPLAGPGTIWQVLRWMRDPASPLYVKPRWDPALAKWLLKAAGRCNARDWHASGLAKGRLLKLSRVLIEDLVFGNDLDCGFAASGFHYVFRDPRAFAKQQRDLPLLADLGIAVRVLDGAELAADEPALKPGMAGALHFPGDAQLRPDRYTAELARIVREAGGVIEEGVCVTGFERGRNGVDAVQTSEGRRGAARVVLALGAWTPEFAHMLRLALPIQPGKGYSITYDRPACVPRRPLVLKERSVCVTAWDDAFLDHAAGLAHDAREFGGVAVGPQLRVAGKMQRAGHAGLQRRLVGGQCRTVEHVRGDAQVREQRQVALLPFERAHQHVVGPHRPAARRGSA